MEIMRTYRMVAEPTDVDGFAMKGLVCIDVVLRGATEDVALVEPVVKAWLDVGCNLPGSWVDEGTSRNLFTVSVQPRREDSRFGETQ